MDFTLTDDQRMLRDTVRRIAETEFAPRAAEIDSSETFPEKNFRILSENGLLGIQVPEEYGGAGAGMLSLILTVEEVARVCASTSVILTTQALASDPLLLGGTEAQKKSILFRMASGQCMGACAITEPGAGSDVAGMKTHAKKVEGGYLLNGSKIFITNGGVSEIVTVLAFTDRTKQSKGISMLLVEKGDKGFSVGKQEHKMGIHGSDTRELTFEDVFVPDERLLGGEGNGFKILMTTFNYTRPAVASQALGIAQGALEAAIGVCQRARPVREASGFIPGHSVDARGNGPRCRNGKDPRLSRRLDDRHGAAVSGHSTNLLDGKMVCFGCGHEGHDRCRADFWRVRVQQGVPRGAHDAGCENYPDLRGDESGSTDHYCRPDSPVSRKSEVIQDLQAVTVYPYCTRSTTSLSPFFSPRARPRGEKNTCRKMLGRYRKQVPSLRTC